MRNRYASRGLAYVVWLNGLGAIALLIGLAHGTLSAESAKRLSDAMMVFGIGAVVGLASSLFAYLRRTVSIELPRQVTERRVLGWLAVVAAIIAAGCFVGALNMARLAVIPGETSQTPKVASPAPATPSPETPSATPPASETPTETPKP